MTDPTPVDTPYGTLYVDPEELVIGRLLQDNGEIPDISEEVAFFRKYLKPGDTAIDVGANYGLFTLALADIVGADGRVVAYEPNRPIAHLLISSVNTQKIMRKFSARIMAVGRDEGYGEVRLDPRGSGGTQIHEIELNERTVGGVCITTLDGDAAEDRPIKAIKIDAEGMDVDVLLGASTILKEDRPAVIFEWNPGAMKSLGKEPLDELIYLTNLSLRVGYDTRSLDGSPTPDPFLGNLTFLPDELL